MTEHTSQALSKRLHDKGFRAGHKWVYTSAGKLHTLKYAERELRDYYPAYTFTELWAVVPMILEIDKTICTPVLQKVSDSKASVWYGVESDIVNDMSMPFDHESPAEALGLLVEWLIGNGHLEVE